MTKDIDTHTIVDKDTLKNALVSSINDKDYKTAINFICKFNELPVKLYPLLFNEYCSLIKKYFNQKYQEIILSNFDNKENITYFFFDYLLYNDENIIIPLFTKDYSYFAFNQLSYFLSLDKIINKLDDLILIDYIKEIKNIDNKKIVYIFSKKDSFSFYTNILDILLDDCNEQLLIPFIYSISNFKVQEQIQLIVKIISKIDLLIEKKNTINAFIYFVYRYYANLLKRDSKNEILKGLEEKKVLSLEDIERELILKSDNNLISGSFNKLSYIDFYLYKENILNSFKNAKVQLTRKINNDLKIQLPFINSFLMLVILYQYDLNDLLDECLQNEKIDKNAILFFRILNSK